MGNSITLPQLYSILNSVGIPVYHYEVFLEGFPYISFMEMEASYSNASGQEWRETTNVIVDHLSKEEWGGESLARLKKALLKNKVKFTASTTWDDKLKVVHTIIPLTVVQDMEV